MIFFLMSADWWTRIIFIGCFLLAFIYTFINNRDWKIWRIGRFSDRATESQVITQMIHSAPYAGSYLVLNEAGKIVGINSRFKKLLGWTEDEIIGFKIDKVFINNSIPDFETFKKEHSTSEDERIIELEAKDRNNNTLFLETSVWKWANELKVIYYTVVVRDISHRKKNEEQVRIVNLELAFMRKLYHEGEKIGNACFWELDVITGKIEGSPNFSNIFGIKGIEIPVENMVKRIIPEDKKRVADTMTNAKLNRTGYEMTYRIVGMDGYINTIHSVASGIKGSNGDLASYIGMSQLIKKEVPNWQ